MGEIQTFLMTAPDNGDIVTISSGLETLKTCASSCLNFISGNVLLMTVFAGGIMTTLAFRFIRKAKRTAK